MGQTLLQLRQRAIFDRFTVFCGTQIEPNVPTMVGAHKHEHDHIMIVTRPPGPGPDPTYRVWYEDDSGSAHSVDGEQFSFYLIRAGYTHWVEQTTPGARGGYACIFSNYDQNGRIADPMSHDEPGAKYSNG